MIRFRSGPAAAARPLRRQGYTILERNVRLGDYEIDIIAREGDTIAFVEVKTRRDHIHLACFQCRRIIEVASPQFERLKAELARETGFELRATRLEVGGICPECRAAAASDSLRRSDAATRA